jgi:hypothetical protein
MSEFIDEFTHEFTYKTAMSSCQGNFVKKIKLVVYGKKI